MENKKDKNTISFDVFFKKFTRNVKSKKLRDLYILKAKEVKQELKLIWERIAKLMQELEIDIDEILDIYIKRKGELRLEEFIREWESIVLKEFIDRKKKAQIVLNYLLKKGHIQDFLKFPKDYREILFSTIPKNKKNKK